MFVFSVKELDDKTVRSRLSVAWDFVICILILYIWGRINLFLHLFIGFRKQFCIKASISKEYWSAWMFYYIVSFSQSRALNCRHISTSGYKRQKFFWSKLLIFRTPMKQQKIPIEKSLTNLKKKMKLILKFHIVFDNSFVIRFIFVALSRTKN